jgi:hypothetical protein
MRAICVQRTGWCEDKLFIDATDECSDAEPTGQIFSRKECYTTTVLISQRFNAPFRHPMGHFTYIAARLLSMSLILSFTFFVRW